MNTPQDSSLGHEVAYPSHYDAGLLFPIPRAAGRAGIGLAGGVPGSSPGQALPFIGHDRWHAYEISWLDVRGKPHVATATFTVPCDSPNLVESKSLKLYLNSLNAERFNSEEALRERVAFLRAAEGEDAGCHRTENRGAQCRPLQGSGNLHRQIDDIGIDLHRHGIFLRNAARSIKFINRHPVLFEGLDDFACAVSRRFDQGAINFRRTGRQRRADEQPG